MVGGWRRLAVGGGWRLVAVGGPWGPSLRAVLTGKKNWGFLRAALVLELPVLSRLCSQCKGGRGAGYEGKQEGGHGDDGCAALPGGRGGGEGQGAAGDLGSSFPRLRPKGLRKQLGVPESLRQLRTRVGEDGTAPAQAPLYPHTPQTGTISLTIGTNGEQEAAVTKPLQLQLEWEGCGWSATLLLTTDSTPLQKARVDGSAKWKTSSVRSAQPDASIVPLHNGARRKFTPDPKPGRAARPLACASRGGRPKVVSGAVAKPMTGDRKSGWRRDRAVPKTVSERLGRTTTAVLEGGRA